VFYNSNMQFVKYLPTGEKLCYNSGIVYNNMCEQIVTIYQHVDAQITFSDIMKLSCSIES